jgi:arginase
MDSLSFLENHLPDKKKISILPISVDIGSGNPGVKGAPGCFFKIGLCAAFDSLGIRNNILPEISTNGDGGLVDVRRALGEIIKTVKKEASNENKVLAIGGDHSISIGTIAGASEALKGDLGVIWIDAHGDINTPETTISGNIHGMSMATLLGIGKDGLNELVKHKIKKENVLYIGLKDLDQPEIDIIRKNKISALTIIDILENGFAGIKEKINLLRGRVDKVWVSLDVDAMDESFAPASLMVTDGGMTLREMRNLMTIIGKTFDVTGLDVVELMPEKDINNKTAKICLELILSAFGYRYDWYSRHMNNYNK